MICVWFEKSGSIFQIRAVPAGPRSKAIELPSGDQLGKRVFWLLLVQGTGPVPSAFIEQISWLVLLNERLNAILEEMNQRLVA